MEVVVVEEDVGIVAEWKERRWKGEDWQPAQLEGCWSYHT